MQMVKLYKYMYYRLYKWNLSAFGEKESPWLNALLEFSLLIFFNVLTIILFLEYRFKVMDFGFFAAPKWISAIIGVIIGGVNYFLLIYKNKVEKIVSEFSDFEGYKKNMMPGQFGM